MFTFEELGGGFFLTAWTSFGNCLFSLFFVAFPSSLPHSPSEALLKLFSLVLSWLPSLIMQTRIGICPACPEYLSAFLFTRIYILSIAGDFEWFIGPRANLGYCWHNPIHPLHGHFWLGLPRPNHLVSTGTFAHRIPDLPEYLMVLPKAPQKHHFTTSWKSCKSAVQKSWFKQFKRTGCCWFCHPWMHYFHCFHEERLLNGCTSLLFSLLCEGASCCL